MQATSTATTKGVRKYTVDELTYKRVDNGGKGYLIDAYHGNRLLMTYKAYYNHRTDEFTLYPSASHRLDPRIPGKHIVPNRKVR